MVFDHFQMLLDIFPVIPRQLLINNKKPTVRFGSVRTAVGFSVPPVPVLLEIPPVPTSFGWAITYMGFEQVRSDSGFVYGFGLDAPPFVYIVDCS